jgi:hypothetical protein
LPGRQLRRKRTLLAHFRKAVDQSRTWTDTGVGVKLRAPNPLASGALDSLGLPSAPPPTIRRRVRENCSPSTPRRWRRWNAEETTDEGTGSGGSGIGMDPYTDYSELPEMDVDIEVQVSMHIGLDGKALLPYWPIRATPLPVQV